MSTESAPQKKDNRVLIALLAVIGVLLLALVALVFFILVQGSAVDHDPAGLSTSTSPSASVSLPPSETPSESPSASPSPSGQAAPPADTKTRFTSFKAPTTVTCDPGDEDNQPPKPPIKVSWSSANAVEAWYSPGNQDAKNKNYMRIPLSGNQDDFTDEHLFPCFDQGPSRDYTITLVGPHGEHVSRTWTVTDLSR
jgi:cytoskeletal protein RodZ